MRVLFSTSYNETLIIPTGAFGGHFVTVRPRACDWGLRGGRKHLHCLAETVRTLRHARRHDAVVLCTVGLEAFLAARLRHAICPGVRVICVDPLVPRAGGLTLMVQTWLQGLDAIGCIRNGDIPMLHRRFGVPREKCFFVPFPSNPATSSLETEDCGFVYSAGWAHRDWPTLIRALSSLPYCAKISPGRTVDIPQHAASRISVLPMQSPESGRALMAKSGLVALSFADTELPSGPLVLLDALGMGKAVVATDTNGTRDYVRDGQTALLVPPGDPLKLASAIGTLMEDRSLAQRMGAEARRDVAERFSADGFVAIVLGRCREPR